MRWKDLRRSSNVRDLRGAGPARTGMPIRIGRGGGGVAVLALLAVAYFVGGPDAVNQLLGSGSAGPDSSTAPPLTANDEAGQFVAAVLGSTEDVWGEIFAQSGATYYQPELTLFDGE